MSDGVKRYISMLMAVLCVLLSGCGGSTEPEIINGETVKTSSGKELTQTAAADSVFTLNYSPEKSLNPMTATNTNNQLVCNLVYENMIELDGNYEPIPNVITEWKTSDGGVHWVFTVDLGRRFHTGEQMTAKDVAYSLVKAMNTDRFSRRLNCIIGCSALDDRTFAVTCSKANMMLPQLLAVPVIKYESYSEDYPIGTGPYTYAKDHKSLVKFDQYKGADTLPLDVVYLKEYVGVNQIISAFEDSYIDVVMNDPSAPTNLGYGSSNEKRGFNTANMHYIGFNTKKGIFAYEGLRYAMNFAFDRAGLVSQFAGYAAEAALPINPACAWYDESYAKQFRYDLSQTQLVLSNMGLSDYDLDGHLEMKVGGAIQEINIDFVTCSASIIKTNAASKFASDMASLGLKVTVRELSYNEYTAALANGEFDMYYAEVRLNPDFDMSMLVSDGARLNYGGIKDEFLDRLVNMYLAADGTADRKAACANMCAQMLNKGYIVPLCFERHQIITHRGAIEGIKANENNPLYNFQNWKISFGNVEAKKSN